MSATSAESYQMVVEQFLECLTRETETFYLLTTFLLHHEEDAKDAIQQMACKAMLALKAGTRPDNMRHWLIRILRNVCIDLRRKRRRLVSIEGAGLDICWEDDETLHPADEARSLLEAALPKVAEQHRMLLAVWMEDKGYDHISSVLNIPRKSVGWKVQAAFNAVRALGIKPGVVVSVIVWFNNGASTASAAEFAYSSHNSTHPVNEETTGLFDQTSPHYTPRQEIGGDFNSQCCRGTHPKVPLHPSGYLDKPQEVDGGHDQTSSGEGIIALATGSVLVFYAQLLNGPFPVMLGYIALCFAIWRCSPLEVEFPRDILLMLLVPLFYAIKSTVGPDWSLVLSLSCCVSGLFLYFWREPPRCLSLVLRAGLTLVFMTLLLLAVYVIAECIGSVWALMLFGALWCKIDYYTYFQLGDGVKPRNWFVTLMSSGWIVFLMLLKGTFSYEGVKLVALLFLTSVLFFRTPFAVFVFVVDLFKLSRLNASIASNENHVNNCRTLNSEQFAEYEDY